MKNIRKGLRKLGDEVATSLGYYVDSKKWVDYKEA